MGEEEEEAEELASALSALGGRVRAKSALSGGTSGARQPPRKRERSEINEGD